MGSYGPGAELERWNQDPRLWWEDGDVAGFFFFSIFFFPLTTISAVYDSNVQMSYDLLLFYMCLGSAGVLILDLFVVTSKHCLSACPLGLIC